jgi:hypothetical protein
MRGRRTTRELCFAKNRIAFSGKLVQRARSKVWVETSRGIRQYIPPRCAAEKAGSDKDRRWHSAIDQLADPRFQRTSVCVVERDRHSQACAGLPGLEERSERNDVMVPTENIQLGREFVLRQMKIEIATRLEARWDDVVIGQDERSPAQPRTTKPCRSAGDEGSLRYALDGAIHLVSATARAAE